MPSSSARRATRCWAAIIVGPTLLLSHSITIAMEPVAPGEIHLAISPDEDVTDEVVLVSQWDESAAVSCDRCSPCLADYFTVFGGLEGSKQPQDFGVNAHFGGRVALDWARLVLPDSGIGVHLGSAVNVTDNAVQVVERMEGTTDRTQFFTTVGVFQRTHSGLLWEAAYDFLYQDYYDDFFLGQWRGRLGYELTCADEVGLQTSLHANGDEGQFGATDVYLRPINQASLYWRHTWGSGARVGGWAGIAEGHAEANIALGDWPRRDEVFLFGSDIYVPLTNYLAIFGEANFLMPADTGTVDAYLGFEFFPWGGACQGRRAYNAPLLPVANNTSFATDLFRRQSGQNNE